MLWGLAALIAFVYQHQTGEPLMNSEKIAYQLHRIDPLDGSLWFAAIAGVWYSAPELFLAI